MTSGVLESDPPPMLPRIVRDARLDVLRGCCVAILVADHIAGWSPLIALTGGGNFYLSAAEGFIVIAGFLFGGVYRKIAERRGMGAVWRKALGRALLVYVSLLLGTAAAVLAGTAVGSDYWYAVHDRREFLRLMWRVATLSLWVHHTRILAMYTVLLACAPAAIWLLRRGHTGWLALGSSALYLAYRISPVRMSWPFPLEAGFHPYAYQVLFVAFVIVGYHRARVAEFFTSERMALAFWIGGAGVAGLILLWLVAQYGLGPVLRPHRTVHDWFNREFLGPGRLLAVTFGAPFFFLLVSRFWALVERYASWLFEPLGRHSLFCYVLHLPFIVLGDWLGPKWQHLGLVRYLVNLLAQLFTLGFVWSLTRLGISAGVLVTRAKSGTPGPGATARV